MIESFDVWVHRMLSVPSTIHNMCSDAGVEDVFVLGLEVWSRPTYSRYSNVIPFHFGSTPQFDRNVLNLLSPLKVISVCQCNRWHAVAPKHRYHISIQASSYHANDKISGRFLKLEYSSTWMLDFTGKIWKTWKVQKHRHWFRYKLHNPPQHWSGTIKHTNTSSFKLIPIFPGLISESFNKVLSKSLKATVGIPAVESNHSNIIVLYKQLGFQRMIHFKGK